MSNSTQDIVWHHHTLTKEKRASIKGQKPCVLWFTGLSGSGKSTIANEVEYRLWKMSKHTYLLDGDNIRMGLNKGLSFSQADRIENIRRIGEVSKLFVDAGMIVLTAFISPFQKDRESVRKTLHQEEFIEIFVDTPIEVCESRDPKGLYKKARDGQIREFTGISSVYEAPVNPEIHIKTVDMDIDECVSKVVEYLNNKGYIDVR